MKPNEITRETIGAAIDVHREFGPGQDEALYEDALEVALRGRKLRFLRQRALPVHYKGVRLDCGFRPDFVVEQAVVLECKAVEVMHPIFQAQVRTYQRLGGWTLGLLRRDGEDTERKRRRDLAVSLRSPNLCAEDGSSGRGLAEMRWGCWDTPLTIPRTCYVTPRKGNSNKIY